MTQLEIAVETLHEALVAQEGGAQSIEIAASLAQDGLTPPLEMVRAICEALQIEVHVMIRPTSRDFVYTPAEIDQIFAQVWAFTALDIRGIVFGAQTPTGALDLELIRRVSERLHEAAKVSRRHLLLTVHRALDTSVDPDGALEQLADVVPRVLTAGHAPTAWEGRDDVRRWIARFGDRITFVASGGLKAEQLKAYIAHTGVPVVHLGSAARAEGVVDRVKVRALRQIVNAGSGQG